MHHACEDVPTRPWIASSRGKDLGASTPAKERIVCTIACATLRANGRCNAWQTRRHARRHAEQALRGPAVEAASGADTPPTAA